MLAEEDFYQEFLSALSHHNVQYMIFGGFAVNLYGFTRVTEDLDLWINPTADNLDQFKRAVIDLKFPEEDHMLKNFLSGNSIMLQLSDEGFRIDAITKLNFKKSFPVAFESCQAVDMPYGKVFFLGYDDLIDEKIRAKRPKHLIDVEQLRIIRGEWKK